MLSKIILGKYLQRLDNIKQWQEMDVFKEESVSQHSYKDSIFARVLLEDIFGNNQSPKVVQFKLDVVTRTLLHDWDEALILRDMSHETKYNPYNGEEIRRCLNALSNHIALNEFREVDEDSCDTDSSRMMWGMICACPEPVKSFAKLCDWIALFFYMQREKHLGNKDLEKSCNIAASKFPEAIDNVINVLKGYFPNEKLNFDELYNLKTIFEDE
jgi:5'-deoxynucleotidase YfbR-like HD superfamily hydrolase